MASLFGAWLVLGAALIGAFVLGWIGSKLMSFIRHDRSGRADAYAYVVAFALAFGIAFSVIDDGKRVVDDFPSSWRR